MKRNFAKLLILPLLAGALSACGKVESDLEIQLEDAMPIAYVGEEYDFSYCIVQEPGFEYKIDAYSYNGAKHQENKLEIVDNFKFTPLNKDPIAVVISADKGKKIHLNKTVSLDVSEKGDPIEELVVNDGYSGYADPGFIKSLNTQPAYIREAENNKTSILVSFNGNNAYPFGGGVFSPNNFRLLPYWKDQTWENAILRFWVYNNSEYGIEFALRLKDNYTKTVDIDMGQEGNPIKVAEPGKWTEITYSLRSYGVTHTLFVNESGTRDDSFTIKARYQGVPEGEFTPLYSYSFYVDLLDVVPASEYPEVDTHLPDTLDRMINTTWCEHFDRELNFNQDYIKGGESSIHFKFTGPTAVAGSQGMCLNSPSLVPLWKDQTWENAILTFWIYNDSSEDIKIQMLLVDDDRNFVIDWNTEFATQEIATPGTWTQVFFSMNRLGVNSPLMKNELQKDEFNIKFLWNGPANTTYEFYVDMVDIVPASDYPQIDTTRVVPLRNETIEDGWENMPQDDGWQKGKVSTEMNEICSSTNPNTATSLKIEFKNADINNHNANPDLALAPEFNGGEANCPSFVGKTFEFDVKFSANITDHSIGLKIVPPGWADKIYQVTPVSGEDGWEHVSIDFSSYASDAETLQTVIRIGFVFNGIDEANKSTAVAYIDNIFLK